MIGLLTDPWFKAEFTTETTAKGHRYIDTLQGADGLFLWCPCGFNNPQYRPPNEGRPHGVIISFANPLGVPPAPPDAGSHNRDGKPTRWTIVSGTGYADLTLSPSVATSCWHGWVKGGVIT